MERKLRMLMIAVVVLAGLVSVVSAAEPAKQGTAAEQKVAAKQEAATGLEATAGTEPQKHWHQIDADWLNKFHNPAEGIEMGLDIRLREVYAPQVIMLDRQGSPSRYHFERYRTRLWANFKLDPDVDINTRLVWEFRTWDDPSTKPQHTDFDEALFDKLNITWRNAFDMPLTLVIGRQEIILGKGWLVLDGTPLDGSRTIFFDAARATYNWKDAATDFDFIYINNASAADQRIKPFNDREAALTEQDEQGFIFEARNKSIKNTELAGYFIYKNDKKITITPKSGNFSPAAWSKDAEIYTIGGRVNGDIDANWQYYAEAATQWGKKEMETLQTYGANSRLTYNFHDNLSNSLRVGYEFLSGDDPGTSTNEQFDPLWGEWPQWSELYVYTYAGETMIGETTNLHRANLGHTFVPAKKWSVDTDYNLLWADQNTRWAKASGAPLFTDDGNFRGQLLTCWVKYACCPNFKLHWLAEYFQPGDYYDRSTRDHALFLRFNIEYTF